MHGAEGAQRLENELRGALDDAVHAGERGAVRRIPIGELEASTGSQIDRAFAERLARRIPPMLDVLGFGPSGKDHFARCAEPTLKGDGERIAVDGRFRRGVA